MHRRYHSKNLLLFLLTGFVGLAHGCKEHSSQPELAQFVFPSEVGTTWTYRHTLSYSYPAGWTYTEISGVHVWQLLSASTLADSTVLVVRSLQNDTTHYRYTVPDYPKDTTYSITVDSTFLVIVRASQIEARWSRTLYMTKVRGRGSYTYMPIQLMSQVPRNISNSSDTVQLSDGHHIARYLSETGLIRYSGNGSAGNFQLYEDLFFAGMSRK